MTSRNVREGRFVGRYQGRAVRTRRAGVEVAAVVAWGVTIARVAEQRAGA